MVSRLLPHDAIQLSTIQCRCFEEALPSKHQTPNRIFVGTVKSPKGFGSHKERNHISVLKKDPKIHVGFGNKLLNEVYLIAVPSFEHPFSNRIMQIDREASSAAEALV